MYAWFWKTAFLYFLHWRNSSRTVHPNKNIIPVILPARSARSSCYLLFLWQYCSQNLDLLENYLSLLTVVWTLPHSWICFLCPFSPVTSPSLLSCIDHFRKGIFGFEESPITQWNKTAYSWMLILQIGKSGFLYILSKPFTRISNNLVFKMLHFGYITDYKWSVHCPSFSHAELFLSLSSGICNLVDFFFKNSCFLIFSIWYKLRPMKRCWLTRQSQAWSAPVWTEPGSFGHNTALVWVAGFELKLSPCFFREEVRESIS